MLEILERIKEAESETRKMLDSANVQAEKIRREAERRADEEYKRTYEEAITETRNKSIELERKARDEAEVEARRLLRQAEEQVKEIRIRAEKRLDEAVDAILKEVLS